LTAILVSYSIGERHLKHHCVCDVFYTLEYIIINIVDIFDFVPILWVHLWTHEHCFNSLL